MPSNRIAKCFSDTLAAIELIETWIADAGGADQAVLADLKARSAIERQLLIVSEAAIRLHKLDPSLAPRLAPDIDWPGIRGIGNFIRHRYDDLDLTAVTDVIGNRLGPLRTACEGALSTLAKGG